MNTSTTMIQTSLGPVTLKTVGDITNTTGTSVCGVVQGSNCSPPLFNIFIDPLAISLYEAIPSRDIPQNALLADDVIVYSKHLSTLQALLDICTNWARNAGMNWNTSKSHVILQEGNEEPHSPLTLSGAPLQVTKSTSYLGVTLTANGTSANRSELRAHEAKKIMKTLRANGTFSPKTNPRWIGNLFSTFVRSKYLYAIHHIPLSQRLITLDEKLQDELYMATLRLKTAPSPNQRKTLNGLFRVRTLSKLRDEYMNNMARKIIDATQSENPVMKEFGERDMHITQQRSAYDALRRALQNPQDAKNQKRAAYVIWNSGRKGKRKPPMFHPKHWILAIRVRREDPTIRLMAIRWHLGNFPLGTDGYHNDIIRLHNMKIHALMKIKPEHLTRQHVADL